MKTDIELYRKIELLKGPVLVFGASGFIGANLVDALIKIRKDCYILTHEQIFAWRLKLLQFPVENIIHCDILSKTSVQKVFEKIKPRTVFNLAAYGTYSKEINVNLIYETNVIGTINILENCKEGTIYIHAGTSSEYGLNCTTPLENEKLIPNSQYAVSKVSASYIVKYYAQFRNIHAINLRLYSVYGEWEEPDRLIPTLIQNLRNNKLPELVSSNISRDFIYISDAIFSLIVSALNISDKIIGNSYNIATGKKTTIAELVSIALNEFNLKINPQFGSMPNRNWDLQDWYGNPEKAKKDLDWTPKVSLNEGLRKIYEWQEKTNYDNSIIPLFEKPQLNPLISVVVACYMDAQAIPILYNRLVCVFNDIKIRYEIIFINDGSPDNSEEILAPICSRDPWVISITHSRNFGSQASFVSGMEICTGDLVVLMDGDLQDPPEIIPKFLEKWKEGFEVIYGKRIKREAPLLMQFFYKIFYLIYRKLSNINIPLDAGDFSMMERKVVKALINLPETEQFLRGLRAWVGFKHTGVEYTRPKRMFGKSTNNLRKNFLWAKKAIFSFSFVPLEFISYLGFALTGISFLALIIQIIAKIFYPEIPHGITTIIVLVLFFGGIQILTISFLGEYISKIFEETKKRPKFIRTKIRKGNSIFISNEQIKMYVDERK